MRHELTISSEDETFIPKQADPGFTSTAGQPCNRRALVIGLGCLAATAIPATQARAESLAGWLVGTWMLESFTSTDEKDVVSDAMGPGATGYLTYGPDGWMSVQLMQAGRKPFAVPDMDGGTPEQTIAAARSFFAYAGPYDVDEANRIVYHNLKFSLMPNWIGGRQKRYVKTTGDDRLELSGDPVLIGGKTQVTRLKWLRRKA